MQQTVKDRIKLFLEKKNLTGIDFCNTIGVSSGFISAMRTSLQPDKIKSIAINYPELSIEWLLTGEGSMLKQPLERNIKRAMPFLREDLVEVPFVSRTASASFIESYCNAREISETISVHGITKEELDKNGYIAFEVDGDSMYPTLKDNSRILAKPVDVGDWEYAVGVHFVCYSNSLVVKRIKKNDLMFDKVLTLSSDNENGGEMTIKKGDIRGMWKAVSIISQKVE